MQPTNLLYIISDQHNRDLLGCYGHPLVQTPNLDRLAARGTRFTSAYTTCPICVPARASLATGRYVHQIGYWDNAFPYDGGVASWHHRLREQGHQVDVIGKLHFRSADDDNGWSREIDPLHVVGGVGDALGCIRENAPFRNKRGGIEEAGPGDSTYLQYDARNAENAVQWLNDAPDTGKPWALFLSFVCPHPPYFSPQELFDLYPPEDIPLPPQWRESDWPDHPAIDYFRRYFTFAPQFDEATIRRMNAAYYGVVTYLDQQIGRVLAALEANDLAQNTRIVYTTDHGEHLGARGIFGKFTLYEESVAVPLILAGPDVPAGKVCETPVSLVDSFPSVLEAVGRHSQRKMRTCLASPGGVLPRSRTGSARSSASTTRWARRTGFICCATGVTNMSITPTSSPNSSICWPTRTNALIWPLRRNTGQSWPTSQRNCGQCSTRKG